MEYRDLKMQYQNNRNAINMAVQEVMANGQFIGGEPIKQLEDKLADYVGVKHCISCANGTDALQLALMSWGVGVGDAVFVPDFTFFSTAEVVPWVGATPIFVDVEQDTYNISVKSLEKAIQKVLDEGKLIPRVVISVDLYGQPADYPQIRKITEKYSLLLLEDGAQGLGGRIGEKKACSFGDISTTSFFPGKPFGCYGDGGAIFTDNDEWAELVYSYKVHGKGKNKYDNIRIGLNSRLDTIQAAILLAKFDLFISEELDKVNSIATQYSLKLHNFVKVPTISKDFFSNWAMYTIRLRNESQRNSIQSYLREHNIPSMIYYSKPLHMQKAFQNIPLYDCEITNICTLCNTVLSLPIHPFLTCDEVDRVCEKIIDVIHQ